MRYDRVQLILAVVVATYGSVLGLAGCKGTVTQPGKQFDDYVAARYEQAPKPHLQVKVIPTFENVGLYLETAPAGKAEVGYREIGGAWREALPLDYDPNDSQYRGSIVSLSPATEYEAVVMIGGDVYTGRFSTWAETDHWPIGKVTHATGSTTVRDSGTPGGYHLVRGARVEGDEFCVRIEANYVIVRGFQCIGQTGKHAPIRVLNGYHDVLVDNNEISSWGKGGESSTSWTGNAFAIGPSSSGITSRRIVFQHNYVHDPAWGPTQRTINGSEGPRAVHVNKVTTGGQFVFRYNTFQGNEMHWFGDVIGGTQNSRLDGAPGRDVDIYGNYFSYCADDCVEIEGGNINVRYYRNYMTQYAIAIGVAIVTKGPVYIFRNVTGVARGRRIPESGYVKVNGGKAGSRNWHGRQHVYHNTFTLVPGPMGEVPTQGNHWSGGPRAQTTTNNIWWVADGKVALADGKCWGSDKTADQGNHHSYEMYWDKETLNECHTITNGIRAKPVYSHYTPRPAPGQDAFFQLQPGTPGHDGGALIPNFSDGFLGAAPDIGAHEEGTGSMCFGHEC